MQIAAKTGIWYGGKEMKTIVASKDYEFVRAKVFLNDISDQVDDGHMIIRQTPSGGVEYSLLSAWKGSGAWRNEFLRSGKDGVSISLIVGIDSYNMTIAKGDTFLVVPYSL